MPKYHYLALQYSAIQKTILRHDRLWSIAGISRTLSFLNEIELPDLACRCRGVVLVAGGGKFTARFEDPLNADAFQGAATKLVATTLPMLEFQISQSSVAGSSLNDVKQRLIRDDLGRQKKRLRGYGVTFNPHLQRCQECGEYPAEERLYRGSGSDRQRLMMCRFCASARKSSRIKLGGRQPDEGERLTTIERIYAEYSQAVDLPSEVVAPLNFADLFPYTAKDDCKAEAEGRKRMAVWFSDINNMNTKVPIWLAQPEDQIARTFDQVKDIFVQALVEALVETRFKPNQRSADDIFLPFRLIVAGGDDLCLVMDECYVLSFAQALSGAVDRHISALPADHPLHPDWLKGQADGRRAEPYSFGAAFVITPVHTPFSRIYAVGEELMKQAKNVTARKANSINWRIMAEADSLTEQLLQFERPLFIDNEGGPDWKCLSFSRYLTLAQRHRNLSGSHTQQLAGWMQETGSNPQQLQTRMIMGAASELEKSYTNLLVEADLQHDGLLMPARLATLLELLSIA